MLGDLLGRWRERRAQKEADCRRVEEQFQVFLEETRPLVPYSPKHPQAALYRLAWKRAFVLGGMHEQAVGVEGAAGFEPELTRRAALYKAFADLAWKKYHKVVPSDAYGTVRLRMTVTECMERAKEERERLSAPLQPPPRPRALACIYVGTDERDMVYVGQTVEAPESRWVQHRFANTGPFKRGAQYVHWRVVEGPRPAIQLDELESYYIGLFDAFEHGHNESRGNHREAYERGCADRAKGKQPF